MASNSKTVADDDGDFSDWIEIYNPDAAPLNLVGWYLTDTAAEKTKWQFPAITVPAGGYLVVFASDRNQRNPAKPLHTNFALDAAGEYLGLVKPDGVTVVSEFAPKFPPQFADISYGVINLSDGTRPIGFLGAATPGAANTSTRAVTTGVQFSRGMGLFSTPFNLTLTGAGPTEHIRYVAVPPSIKGALLVPEPTAASPLYTGPLVVSDSLIIRAAIFSSDDRARGQSTKLHYLKLMTSGAQRADTFTSALPLVVLGMHGYGPPEENGAVVPGWVHLFTPAAGGTTSFTNTAAMSSAAMLNVRGFSSALFPKKGYNFDLVDSAGEANSQSLLGLSDGDSWALVSPWNYDRTYVHNAFVYALSNRLGRWAPLTRFVEVFLDGDGTLDAADYAGISLLTEPIKIASDRLDLASLSQGDTSGSELTGGYILKLDVPDSEHWSFITDHGLPNIDSTAVIVDSPNASKLQTAQRNYIKGYVQDMENALYAGRDSGWSNRTYLNYLDLPSWVDHHLMEVFVGNVDGLAHSEYFYKDRDGKIVAGPVWDFDRALGSYDPRQMSLDSWNPGPIDVWAYCWYGLLAHDSEFMQAWIDRWQSLRGNELSAAALNQLADSLAAGVTPAAAARDAARWADNVSPTGNGFAGEIARLKTWLTNRAAWIDRQFVAPPVVSEAGGSYTLQAPAGARLAYTLDGSDPRSLDGSVAPNTLLIAGPLTVPASANVHARSYQVELRGVFPGSPWSSAVGGRSSTPLSPRARLVNISSRGFVGTGENALIAGVVVADSAGKGYLARAIGPTLATFGVAGAVPDPQLSIFNSGGLEIFRNNGWQNGPSAAKLPQLSRSVGAFALPAGSADSVLTNDLNRGAYTIQITTPSGRTGVGLAELYELDANGRTLNLSTRALVRTGDGALIGGFFVQGPAYKRMLVRGVGPTLAAFGVANALPDPVLTIYTGATVVASNDRWSTGDGATLIPAASAAVGAFALVANSEDAALLITLPPGAYTVKLEGKGAAEGVALIEIYELP